MDDLEKDVLFLLDQLDRMEHDQDREKLAAVRKKFGHRPAWDRKKNFKLPYFSRKP